MQKILHLDDSQTSVTLAKKLLSDIVEVVGVNNIPDAIKKSEEQKFDLFLIDYQIGSKTSFEFADYLRLKSETHKDTPIILATAFRSDGLFYKASQRGINDFISKPFDKVNLPTVVTTYLKNPSQRRNFKPSYTTAQCIAWKLGDKCYQYSPDIQETVSAANFEEVGKKMRDRLEAMRKNALVEFEIVLHNIPFSE